MHERWDGASVHELARGIRRDVRGRGREAQTAWSLGAKRSVCVRHVILIERFAACWPKWAREGLSGSEWRRLAGRFPSSPFCRLPPSMVGWRRGTGSSRGSVARSTRFALSVGQLEVSLFMGE